MAIFFLANLFSVRVQAENQAEDTVLIRYPESESDGSIYARKAEYLISVLRLALEKSESNYKLQKVVLPAYTGSRNMRNLESKAYDVSWLHTTQYREENLLLIRIPLFKGLIGWRLMFIRKQDEEAFSKITKLSDLQNYIAGQGHDWPDAEILRFNHLKYFTSVNRNGYFKMLDHGRIDYFPRALVELWYELDMLQDDSITADRNILVRYPSAYYFFVRKENSDLAKIIETGLLKAYADGSFDRHFYQHYGDEIERSNLNSRVIIDIENPNFPKGNTVFDKRFWFKIEDDSK